MKRGIAKSKKAGRSGLVDLVTGISSISPIFGAFQDQFRNEQLNRELGRRERQMRGITNRNARTQYSSSDEAQAAESALLKQQGDALRQGYDARTNETLKGYSDAEKDIMGRFDSRLAESLKMLDGMGENARREIGDEFKRNEGAIAQNLVDRGLGGTSVAASMATGNTKQKVNALGGLNEALRQQRLGVYGQLSGDAANQLANIRGATLGAKAGLTADELGAGDTSYNRLLDQNRYYQGQRAGIADTQASRQLGIHGQFMPSGPGPGDFAGALGAVGGNLAAAREAAYDPPSNPWSVAGPLVGAGIGTAGNVVGASMLANAYSSYMSSKASKTDKGKVKHGKVLKALSDMPVSTWRYKGGNERHIGPMAEDFAKVGGGTGKTINVSDAIGTLFSAVKALEKRTRKGR